MPTRGLTNLYLFLFLLIKLRKVPSWNFFTLIIMDKYLYLNCSTMNKSEIDDIEIIPKVKVLKIDNKLLKSFGELCINDTSRRIMLVLSENQMYVNEIAKKLNMRVSLVVHHLKKMIDLGIIDIEEKPISKKTKNHKYFKLNADIYFSLTPEDNNKLERIFKDGVKFVGIGIVGIVTSAIITLHQYLPLNKYLN